MGSAELAAGRPPKADMAAEVKPVNAGGAHDVFFLVYRPDSGASFQMTGKGEKYKRGGAAFYIYTGRSGAALGAGKAVFDGRVFFVRPDLHGV